MLPVGHCLSIFLLATMFFLVSGGCAVSPEREWAPDNEEEKGVTTDSSLIMSKREQQEEEEDDDDEVEYMTTEEDRPRILCGQALIYTLKEQCGARGTFSPYHKRSVRNLIRLARAIPGRLILYSISIVLLS